MQNVVMPMNSLIEYNDKYLKTSGSLWQYYRDDRNDNIAQSQSFKYKIKITRKTVPAGNTKDVKIAVSFKYLSNFWRALEMSLINCDISFDLTWSKKCAISSAVGKTEFATTDTKLYVPVVTLSTEDNVNLLKQLESGFKRTINWNKYRPKFETLPQNRYFNYLIDPSFQGVNKLVVILFENETDREVHTKYYPPSEEIKDYDVIIDGRNFFDQPIKNDFKANNNIRKIATGQGDDYTTGCLVDYNYFKEHYKLITKDLSKQQKLDADPKVIQQINFTGNIEKEISIFFITEEAKGTVLDFSKGTVKVL